MISRGGTASGPRAWWAAAVEELWLVVPPGALIFVNLRGVNISEGGWIRPVSQLYSVVQVDPPDGSSTGLTALDWCHGEPTRAAGGSLSSCPGWPTLAHPQVFALRNRGHCWPLAALSCLEDVPLLRWGAKTSLEYSASELAVLRACSLMASSPQDEICAYRLLGKL